MKKGDRFAALGYNCVEWMDIYAAAAKGGFIVVPIMFRLSTPEMEYNINHSECKAFLVQGGKNPRDGKEFPWIEMADGMKKNLPTVEKYISFAVDNPHYDGWVSLGGRHGCGKPRGAGHRRSTPRTSGSSCTRAARRASPRAS